MHFKMYCDSVTLFCYYDSENQELRVPFASKKKMFDLNFKLRRDNGKNSYERRAYESVDDGSPSWVASQK